MKFYSTKRQSEAVSFEEAVKKGLPPDNGLYWPEYIPRLGQEFFDRLSSFSLQELAHRVLSAYIEKEIPEENLIEIVEDTFCFEIPLKQVHEHIHTLELFHGPTLAFKDVGARFMSRCLNYFLRNDDEEITILTATSGDTGSAVVNACYGIEEIQVVVLYPDGHVSRVQEQQMTTLGGNITALKVKGTFDDCQRLVKSAFLDAELKQSLRLTSANSINIARLLPQSIYYYWAMAQLGKQDAPITVSVPSGNYGNLTAGLLAKASGLPIDHFVASSNANDIVPQYLWTGGFNPKDSVRTISNAMDVGNPSNFQRMLELCGNEHSKMTKDITGKSYSDAATKAAIREVYEQTQYIMDPHGAVGYLGLKDYLTENAGIRIFLETAHYGKFMDVVEDSLNQKLDLPEPLRAAMDKENLSIPVSSDFREFKEILMS
ncbi:MAG: threonine synthase [Bacteroidota bacterium]